MKEEDLNDIRGSSGSLQERIDISKEKEKSENRQKPQRPKYRYGRWDEHEDRIYMDFIVANENFLESEAVRRSTRVFQKLSNLLDYKRSADQCRSHHQKMKRMSRYGTTQSILTYLNSKYRRKQLLKEMKSKNNAGVECEKVAPTAGSKSGKDDFIEMAGYTIRFRTSPKSLMMNFEIDDDLIDKW